MRTHRSYAQWRQQRQFEARYQRERKQQQREHEVEEKLRLQHEIYRQNYLDLVKRREQDQQAPWWSKRLHPLHGLICNSRWQLGKRSIVIQPGHGANYVCETCWREWPLT